MVDECALGSHQRRARKAVEKVNKKKRKAELVESVIKASSASEEKNNFPFILALVILLLSAIVMESHLVTYRIVSRSQTRIEIYSAQIMKSTRDMEKDEIYLPGKTNRERTPALYPSLTSRDA